MAKQYKELVISAPFILVKGFLMGLIEGTGKDPVYFFSQRSGIRVETLSEGLKEWLGFENLVHLCLEDGFAERLKQGIENTHKKLGMELRSEKLIESAGFEFHARFFDKDEADSFHSRVDDHLPEGVYLDGFKEAAVEDPGHESGVGMYTASHKFQYKGKGTIVGEFGGVIQLFHEFQKDPMVEVEAVRLNF